MLDGMTDHILQRASGCGRVAVGPRGLEDLHQSGSAKVMLPNVYGTSPHAVLVNTAGGITGGDHFEWTATAAKGAALTLTTQTAERGYCAREADLPGHIYTCLNAAAGSRLHWLPQETILFDRAALSRRLTVRMAEDAEVLLLEPLILGRTAMGETVFSARFSDQWRVYRGDQLVYADAVRLWGDISTLTKSQATFAGDLAAASLTLIASDAEDRLAAVRKTLAKTELTAGASAWNGCLAIRATAADGQSLRRGLIPLLEMLRQEDLPRVWHM